MAAEIENSPYYATTICSYLALHNACWHEPDKYLALLAETRMTFVTCAYQVYAYSVEIKISDDLASVTRRLFIYYSGAILCCSAADTYNAKCRVWGEAKRHTRPLDVDAVATPRILAKLMEPPDIKRELTHRHCTNGLSSAVPCDHTFHEVCAICTLRGLSLIWRALPCLPMPSNIVNIWQGNSELLFYLF